MRRHLRVGSGAVSSTRLTVLRCTIDNGFVRRFLQEERQLGRRRRT